MVTSDDRDAPRLTLRASNVQQLQSQLQELEAAGVLVDIGRVAALFQVKARIGANLGAAPLDPDKDGGSFDNVQAAAPVAPSAAAIATPPAAPVAAKAPAKFPAFKAPAAAATPPATPPPAAKSEATEPPPAAPAANGFPAAPAWKKP